MRANSARYVGACPREPRVTQTAAMSISIDLSSPEARDAARPAGARSEKPSLVGLTREELGRALAEAGVPERQVKMRVQ